MERPLPERVDRAPDLPPGSSDRVWARLAEPAGGRSRVVFVVMRVVAVLWLLAVVAGVGIAIVRRW